jgi:hypothetical protein
MSVSFKTNLTCHFFDRPISLSFERGSLFVHRSLNCCLAAISFLGDTIIQILQIPLQFIGSKFITLPEVVVRIAIYAKKVILSESRDSFKKEVFGASFELVAEKPSKERAKEAFKYARYYATTQRRDENWLPEGSRSLIDYEEDGLKFRIFEEGDTIQVVYGALGAAEKGSWKQNLRDAVWNVVGGRPKIYERAHSMYLEATRQYPQFFENKQIIFSGVCLGGSLATYVGLKEGREVHCLNSLGIGPGIMWNIGRDRLRRAAELVTQFSVEGDFASAPITPLRLIDWIINFLGIRTIGVVGKCYIIPHLKRDRGNFYKIHVRSLEALFYYIFPEKPVLEHLKELKEELKSVEKELRQASGK